jgi:magnesium chelatase subunit I
LQVTDEVDSLILTKAFETVPGLTSIVHRVGLAREKDAPVTAAACELVLESLVARRKISRSDTGQYGRAPQEPRRRKDQDMFGGGMSA